MASLFDKIIKASQKKQPFVAYRKPNSNFIKGFFQEDDTLFFTSDFTEKGFVFAPFDSEKEAVLIPENQSEYIEEEIGAVSSFKSEEAILSAFNHTDKRNHLELVKEAIKNIGEGAFKKVVVSRKELMELTNFDIQITFQKLLESYPNAFVYVWYHPKVGLWFGASPENLLHISDAQFTTVALAGTQVNAQEIDISWQAKELEEQQLVTNFIESQLSPIVHSLKIGERTTIKAGNLLHLKTIISGKIENQTTALKALIHAIHPTPAVCGLPRQVAKDFIQQHEHYERTYYTGFLGELNLNVSKRITTALFVNLRCMEIQENFASLFIGGGITKESHPEKEWEETVAKSLVMRKVL